MKYCCVQPFVYEIITWKPNPLNLWLICLKTSMVIVLSISVPILMLYNDVYANVCNLALGPFKSIKDIRFYSIQLVYSLPSAINRILFPSDLFIGLLFNLVHQYNFTWYVILRFCTGLYQNSHSSFAHNRSLTMKRAIQFYFTSHV